MVDTQCYGCPLFSFLKLPLIQQQNQPSLVIRNHSIMNFYRLVLKSVAYALA